MKVFARNFRGFREVEVDTAKVSFLVGDNSCGKSSLIYLVEAVTRGDLTEVPRIGQHSSVDEFDYFSPYFDYDDVVFGFKTENKRKLFAKIVTVSRRGGSRPALIRCTYFDEDSFVSFRIGEGGLERSQGKVSSFKTDDLVTVHNTQTLYKKVKSPEKMAIGEPVALLVTSSAKSRDKDHKIFAAAMGSVASSARIVFPIRALPEKYYTFIRKFNTHGKHFASMWFDFEHAVGDVDNAVGFHDVSKFGVESGLFESISVKKIAENIEDSPLVVTVNRSGKDFLLNQVGIGVSQVVPVLIDTIYSMNYNNPPLLMQQPELHLHPIAQAALGTYLAKCCYRGLRPAIETHSSYLIDRFRAEIRDFEKMSDKPSGYEPFSAEIIFCERNSDGNSTTHIPILADGSLHDAPDRYHSFFVEELVRTML